MERNPVKGRNGEVMYHSVKPEPGRDLSCFIKGCSSSGFSDSSICFFVVPKPPAINKACSDVYGEYSARRYQKWQKALNLRNLPNKEVYVCSKHFMPVDYVAVKLGDTITILLKGHAVPQLDSVSTQTLSQNGATNSQSTSSSGFSTTFPCLWCEASYTSMSAMHVHDSIEHIPRNEYLRMEAYVELSRPTNQKVPLTEICEECKAKADMARKLSEILNDCKDEMKILKHM